MFIIQIVKNEKALTKLQGLLMMLGKNYIPPHSFKDSSFIFT